MTPAKELDALRLSLRRVAEVANLRHDAGLTIPFHGIGTREPTAERGWNDLCSDLIGWMERLP